jgi:uncharacterized protein (DUF342 family)
VDRDGVVELTISDDGMTVVAAFLPPVGEGRLLEPDYVETMLEARGVVFGIDQERIGEAVFAVNTERRIQEDIVVARGSAPQAARPAYFEIISGVDDTPHHWDERERADYKMVSRLPVVHAGEVIARRIPEREGVVGMTVRGEEIPFTVESVDTTVPGEHTRIAEDEVIAEIGGQLEIRGGAFHIIDRLEITGSVGFATGSIEFPGDVILRGEVKDGFHIWAGRSITAAATVDVSEVYCRGDFTSTAGVIGRGKALLRCGGKVQARFASSCYVESKSSVFLEHYAYQSHIGCRDRLAMGKKGRIVGGVVTSVNGIHAFAVGNQAAVPTLVRAGIDFIAERKLRLLTEKHQAVTLRLQRLVAVAGEDPTDRQLDILNRLEESRSALASQMGEVAGALDANEGAGVVVDGPVFPGVQVQICRSSYTVSESLTNVRFSLEKETGRVVVAPIKQDE